MGWFDDDDRENDLEDDHDDNICGCCGQQYSSPSGGSGRQIVHD